jgi:hypothetical protein
MSGLYPTRAGAAFGSLEFSGEQSVTRTLFDIVVWRRETQAAALRGSGFGLVKATLTVCVFWN